jgi:segregation and condensation protein A
MAYQGTTASGEMGSAFSYQVKLPLFEGPLDLLMFLIRKDQIDIYDIPIGQITHEYLQYLKLMRLLQLDMAGEFLVMASTLMSIKSQLLLPQHTLVDDLFPEDPRQELVNKLLEYRLFKAAAQTLEHKEQNATLLYARSGDSLWMESEQEHAFMEVSLFDLLTAFKDIVGKGLEAAVHEVELEEITVKERCDYILDVLVRRKKVPFVELIRSDPRKMVMVVTFLALLELIRSHLVSVRQQRAFGQIWILGKTIPGESRRSLDNTHE